MYASAIQDTARGMWLIWVVGALTACPRNTMDSSIVGLEILESGCPTPRSWFGKPAAKMVVERQPLGYSLAYAGQGRAR